MSDFWNLSDGGDATEDVSTSYEVASGSFEAFPEGTKLLAMVTDAEWRVNEQSGLENLSLTWTVVKPEEVANRKVFQSLWLTDLQPEAKDPEKKRDKARRMFAAIDANAGGKLAKKPGKPDAELNDKPEKACASPWNATRFEACRLCTESLNQPSNKARRSMPPLCATTRSLAIR